MNEKYVQDIQKKIDRLVTQGGRENIEKAANYVRLLNALDQDLVVIPKPEEASSATPDAKPESQPDPNPYDPKLPKEKPAGFDEYRPGFDGPRTRNPEGRDPDTISPRLFTSEVNCKLIRASRNTVLARLVPTKDGKRMVAEPTTDCGGKFMVFNTADLPADRTIIDLNAVSHRQYTHHVLSLKYIKALVDPKYYESRPVAEKPKQPALPGLAPSPDKPAKTVTAHGRNTKTHGFLKGNPNARIKLSDGYIRPCRAVGLIGEPYVLVEPVTTAGGSMFVFRSEDVCMDIQAGRVLDQSKADRKVPHRGKALEELKEKLPMDSYNS